MQLIFFYWLWCAQDLSVKIQFVSVDWVDRDVPETTHKGGDDPQIPRYIKNGLRFQSRQKYSE